jgi:hypothetical protein
MGENIPQFYSTEDECVYFYDRQKSRYRKVCDVASFNELPFSVKQQIKAAKQETLGVLELPMDL